MPYEPATDQAALKAEIALPAYAGMTEPEIATALNARNIAADTDVPVLSIDRYLASNGIWGRIDARADYYRSKLAAEPGVNSVNERKLAALRTMARALERLPDFQTSNPANKAAVFALIENLYLPTDATPTPGEGLITLQQRNQLRQMVAGLISRAEQMFGAGTRITSGDVSRARAS